MVPAVRVQGDDIMHFRSLGAIVALIAATPAAAQDAPSLIAKNLEARGGAAAMAAIKSVSFEGKTRFPGDFEVDYREWRLIDGPATYGKVIFSLQGLDIVQAYDGEGGWKVNPLQGRKDAERMSADEARQLADSALMGGALLQAASDGSKVTYLGREDFDGTAAYKLKVAQKDGDSFVYWLDPDTFLEIKIDETRRIRGAEQTTEIELGDYEKVAGVYFPMSVEAWSQGQPNQRSRTNIAKATANPAIGRDLFMEPKSAASPAPSTKGN
jgi:hypothetical protein